jgi:hypothetical protein
MHLAWAPLLAACVVVDTTSHASTPISSNASKTRALRAHPESTPLRVRGHDRMATSSNTNLSPCTWNTSFDPRCSVGHTMGDVQPALNCSCVGNSSLGACVGTCSECGFSYTCVRSDDRHCMSLCATSPPPHTMHPPSTTTNNQPPPPPPPPPPHTHHITSHHYRHPLTSSPPLTTATATNHNHHRPPSPPTTSACHSYTVENGLIFTGVTPRCLELKSEGAFDRNGW